MIADVLLAFVTVALLMFDMVHGTREIECPRGWRPGGIAAHDKTSCEYVYGCVDTPNVRGGWTSTCEGTLVLQRQLWCDVDERAVVNLRGIIQCQHKE